MDLVAFLGVLATLFVLIALVQPLAERVRLPFTVLIAVMGIVIGVGAGYILRTDLTDAFDPIAQSILSLPVGAQTFLYVFLPTLLFQVALTLNLRRMLDDWVPILVMAVLAVVVATFVIGFALTPFTTLPLVVCLLVGAIVATTDPSAVVSIFREIGAPARLTRLIEGESLLNDAAAIALFGAFVALTLPGAVETKVGAQWLAFVGQLGLGALVGYGFARAAVVVLEWLGGWRLAQVSLSVALPYVTYIASEQLLGVSGVLAVVAAGATLNFIGPGRLAPANWTYLRDTWELLAHWAGSLIFVLAALLVPRLLDTIDWSDVALVGVVVVAATVARAITLFGVLPLLRLVRASPPMSIAYKVVILWGGLRGAVTLALALAVTENPQIPADAQRTVAVLATGFTLFTLLVQGTTLRPLIRWLKLDRLSPLEAALQRQVVAVALQTVREEVASVTGRHGLTRETVRAEAKDFASRLDRAVEAAEEAQQILDRDRLTLGLVTLAGREREVILEGFRERTISARLIERMLGDASRLIEATRTGGRSAYRATARGNVAHGRGHAVAAWLHRLGISRPLGDLVAARFEVILITRMILRDLHDFVDDRILRIHGRRVTDLLHEVLARREEELDREIEGLRLQYPGYADALERSFIRRTRVRLEEREVEASFDDGLIGADLYASLMRGINARRRIAEARPRLDLSLHKREMVAQFPMFAALTEAQRRRLSRALVTIYAEPGDSLLRRGEQVRSVFFIASGAVERDARGQMQRLGRGEMFGEIALLAGQKVRRGRVRAITHCTLLRLDEARFLRLLRRLPDLRARAIEAAAEQGGDPAIIAARIEAA
ncbi:sodium:proton antiporter [Rhodobaculum claviforme]|uniref:Sodium:proton antiporter n=1 Tax=Rhodobaculum claviforme TaxID=1549854 RepID=A0A934TIV3_9RHOB|nr:sodium:proton antiporter [Rhodobaculum claviforme]